MKTSDLELDDIQGLVIRSHGDLPKAAYLILKITSEDKAREWLRNMIPQFANARNKRAEPRMQIAFTWEGLTALGIPAEAQGFRPEFVQGMNTDYRARLLGDLGESSTENWSWGGSNNDIIHLVVMVYAADNKELGKKLREVEPGLNEGGMSILSRLQGEDHPTHREHFGFRDGLSQPVIEGLNKQGSRGNPMVPAGEFILGYKNAYEEFPESPLVPEGTDKEKILPRSRRTKGMNDLGKNGSYMVFRQLRQDVKRFWDFLEEAVKKENPSAGSEEAIQLAAKMVGRWPGGCPVTLSPDRDNPLYANENDFRYQPDDKEGFQCPAGAHIRRSNPRDSILMKPENSMRISKRHRILRRGRIFGPPLVDDLDPTKLMKAKHDGAVRGLQFICFNANISRQFEFIQHTWTDNTKFQGMYDDPDPILGIKDSRNKSHTHDFTIPAKPLRRKVQGLQRHVHVMGGAYFFMPGFRALQYLANLDNDPTLSKYKNAPPDNQSGVK